ncbi:hypothetical protein ERO13_D12G076200v2 [Gossypium hirsutum]|uniref:VQ domain-containing protein n=1 Tax=Gossypium hirsutum TaxID=3635 RepID=A0A1U8NHX2_GOSHI|nr:uncharacterized protein LOC107947443 [Gossypium hirsutum]KAG4115071.1 hypothetical protein ERO13_D12G076200v2 [Gossypium hirsutum]
MEAYSSYAAAAAASSSEEARGLKASQASFHGSLHSVRKPLSKPWKKPIAPFPPTPPKVYTVDPINFRDLVQQLTGAPQFMSQSHNQTSTSQFQAQQPQQQRLQRVAPPALHVAAPPLSRTEVSAPLHLVSGLYHTTSQNQNFSDNAMFTSNSLGLTLSPSLFNWCTFPILSPGTLASLEQSTVP